MKLVSNRNNLIWAGVVTSIAVALMIVSVVASGDAVILLVVLGSACMLMVIAFYLAKKFINRVHPPWRKRATERIVISQITGVARQNLPMATALALAAQSERHREQIRLQQIAGLLGQGLPLSEAIRIGYPECPSLVVSLIAAGEKAGQLPAALEQAEQYLIDRDRRWEQIDCRPWGYVLVVMATMVFLVTGIMIAVIPKFKHIFQDFDTELPTMTQALIHVSEWFLNGAPPGWVWVALIGAVPIAIYFFSPRRRVPDPAITTRLADWIRWHIPGRRRMEWGQGMALMLRVMRFGIRSGMGLDEAAATAAQIDVNAQLRPRMAKLGRLLADGADVRQAADKAGLGGATAIALSSGRRSGNMDAALRYAADYHDAIMSRWWIVFTSLAWPVCTIAMAMVVGFIVVAMFLPLITLINSVAIGG